MTRNTMSLRPFCSMVALLPFVIFFDTTSKEGADWNYYRRTAKRIDAVGETKGNPVLQALQQGRYMYVYLTTIDSPKAIESSHSTGKVKHGYGVIRLNKEITAEFFGPVFPMYEVLRTTTFDDNRPISVIADEQKQRKRKV